MQLNEPVHALVGKKFGKWEVLEVIPGTMEDGYVTKLRCRCECGVEKIQHKNNVVHGRTLACKRCSPGRRKHGLSGTKLYYCWSSINNHCKKDGNKNYRYYGGKGLTVCDQWREDPVSFINWCRDHGWVPGARVVRIDKSRGYDPDNMKIVGGVNVPTEFKN